MPHPAWNGLLAWLASHGMDVSHKLHVDARPVSLGYGMFALRELPPSTPLFTIPASALLNSESLSRHYPGAKPQLSSVQLISLHLLLHRPSAPAPSLDPLFGPYISALPASFDTHPLTWCGRRRCPPPGSWLLEHLPPFVRRDLDRVAKTCQADWERVRSYVRSKPKILLTATNPNAGSILSDADSAQDDYLWAWLNVNTRCIYYRIKQSKGDPDNLTLCPILDFANHSSVEASMVPQASSSDIWDMAPLRKSAEDLVLLSPSGRTILPGDELFLRYGYHSNQFLFTEYGFANSVSEKAILNGDEHNDVDISPFVEDLFKEKGWLGEWIQDRLLEEGYWGEWTLHAAPTPAHPSYRLISALRLYHSLLPGTSSPEDIDDIGTLLSVWRRVVNGEQESVSEENEVMWKRSLLRICESMVNISTDRIDSLLSTWSARKAQGVESSAEDMVTCVVSLWREETFVAKAVVQSLRNGASF